MSIDHNIKLSVQDNEWNKSSLEQIATLFIKGEGRLTELSHKPIGASIRDVSLTIRTGNDDAYKPGDKCYLATGTELLFIAYHPHHPCAVVEGAEGIFITPFDNLYTAEEYKEKQCLEIANDAANLIYGVSIEECNPVAKSTIMDMVAAGFEKRKEG
ncbi:hypothetical protein [Vibrio phage vB_VpM-pA2SJ1]|uniref:Uncharacterized protein n=1 Tax=Vibrio phage vB_VpM-pA2SJ1 TaxID=3095964 RepID=A0AAX4J5U4_9CAUD